MPSDETDEKLAEAKDVLAKISAKNPNAVMFAMLETLIDVACGENPHLRTFMRLQIYIAVLRHLAEKGVEL